jgi:hypothetical protein
MTKVLRVDDDVHKFLKIMAAQNGFKNINDTLAFIIKNLKKKEINKMPIRTRYAGEPL